MNKTLMKKIMLITFDAIIFLLFYFACAFLVNGFKFYESYSIWLLLSIFGEVAFKIGMGVILNCYNHLWIYRNKRDLFHVVMVSTFCNLIVMLVNLIFKYTSGNVLIFSVLIFSFALELLYLLFSRIALSYYLEIRIRKYSKKVSVESYPTMIIGAGSAGQTVYNEILRNQSLGLDVIGFIDDDSKKIGNYICNKKVFGPVSELNTFTKKYKITNLIIACPSAGRERIKEIVNLIDYKDMNVMIMPEIGKFLTGELTPSLRKVNICDLLGRDEVELDKSGIKSFILDKVVLITGGGGSIGSELCRQIVTYSPKKLIIFDIYENSTYELEMELESFFRNHEEYVKPEIDVLIGSIRDKKRLEEIFEEYKPNLVFHAAAHKHVPLMEDSPKEAIKNNVVGTYNVALFAMKYKVDKMVMISTDKAVNPTNVMGASKRFAEMVIEAFDSVSDYTRFSMVRFGNVLGSNGSVIPLFKKQIENGGPITVTSTEINRFFMTIPEACSLVIQSCEYAKGGEKFILDMGEPVKIIDLARKMIQLSGLIEGQDISIEVTGLRPGEKLYEEILLDKNKALKTENDKIYIEEKECVFSIDEIDEMIKKLSSLDKNSEILDYLKEVDINKKEVK